MSSINLTAAQTASKNLTGLEVNVSFFPDEQLIEFLSSPFLFPTAVATLVAQFATHHFDEVIFGPWHWKHFWGATPVTLPSLRDLHQRVHQVGKETPKALEEMRAEECANFLGELGKEDRPQPPQDLIECLNKSFRAGERAAKFLCAATYIPEFVRKDGKVMAVTARTLALEFGPKPKQGNTARLYGNPQQRIDEILKPEDADSTQTACYFVMELDVSPGTKGMSPAEAMAMAEILAQEIGKWKAPEPRNFLATVFSRRAWKGVFHFGNEPWTGIYCHGNARGNHPLIFGGFCAEGLYLGKCFDEGDEDRGAVSSRKFRPLTV